MTTCRMLWYTTPADLLGVEFGSLLAHVTTMLQQRHMDDGLTARWSIDPEDGPSSRQACPKGVYVVLTAALPDGSQTISAVPLAHNTVPQDCSRILEERTIRPSYYDRGDDTWIPSVGFFCRLKFPSSAIRAPVLDGTQWSHLLDTCLSARKYGGTETATRPTCVLAWLYMRQHAHIKAAGGSEVYDSTFSHYFDLVRGTDGRWLARSSRTVIVGPAVFWSCWNR